MRKFIFALAFAISVFCVIKGPAPAHAMDRGGCLTCHRYPGLVKYETSDKIKVLHIDEDKYLMTPHAKTECRECHPKTVQIPHTDITEVECTKKCHSEDKEKIDTIDRTYLIDFHKEEKFAITRLDDESSCRVCHPLYPHSENNRVRALVNMHTGFMLCEVCHFRKDHRARLIYDWKAPEEFEFTGEPYGTHEKKEVKEEGTSDSVISTMLKMFDEEKEGEERTDIKHFISRIAMYKTEEGRKKLYINTQDNSKAEEFLIKEKKFSQDKRKKELDFFHRDIAKKEISVACNECHSPEGIMDFTKLGFSKSKSKDLQYLNIKGLVTKYETFIIPNLFGPKN